MLNQLNELICFCRRCPRLVDFRENVAEQKPWQNFPYWRRPVPGNGDPHAWLLIIGLAPAQQGGNRTGRIFTGDKTSVFLTKALYETGFANQPTSISKEDGLIFTGCYLTAAVKCVPPDNKPTRQECLNCNSYLKEEMTLLTKIQSVLLLGKTAFDAFFLAMECKNKKTFFSHGQCYHFEKMPKIYASYHPTPRNTNTGTLTEKMFRDVLEKIKKEKE